MAIPFIFANESGQIGASQLDQNFAYCLANATPGNGSVQYLTLASALIAQAADFRADTAQKLLTTDQTWASAALVALADAATVAVDFNTGINFSLTLGGNRTLGSPTNANKPQGGFIAISQDAGGSRTLGYGANWKFTNGTAPTLTTTPNALDLLFYQWISATQIYGSMALNVK